MVLDKNDKLLAFQPKENITSRAVNVAEWEATWIRLLDGEQIQIQPDTRTFQSGEEKTYKDVYQDGHPGDSMTIYYDINGKIDYLWFDGCGSENHTYDTERIIAAIRGMQTDILIFNMWDPDTRWVGNEAGVAPYPNFNVVNALDFSVRTDRKDLLPRPVYMPGECDCRMRRG